MLTMNRNLFFLTSELSEVSQDQKPSETTNNVKLLCIPIAHRALLE